MHEILSKRNNIEQFLEILNSNDNDIDIIHNIVLKARNVLLDHDV